MDEQRKQFEEWCDTKGMFVDFEDGDYFYLPTRACWHAWQAAQEAAKPKWISVDYELPVVPDGHDCDYVDIIVAVIDGEKERSSAAIFCNGKFLLEGGDGILYELRQIFKWMYVPKP